MNAKKFRLAAGITAIASGAFSAFIYLISIIMISLAIKGYTESPLKYADTIEEANASITALSVVLGVFAVIFALVIIYIVLGALMCRNKPNKGITVALIVLSVPLMSLPTIAVIVLSILYLTNIDKQPAASVSVLPAAAMEAEVKMLKQLKEDGLLSEEDYAKAVSKAIDKHYNNN